jgi:hypothetical protein
MKKIKYFNNPTQLMFVNPDAPEDERIWSAGIGFRDSVIWSSCGKVFNISEVCARAEKEGCIHAIYEYASWIDLTEEIVGGMAPNGLEKNPNGRGYVETCRS